MQSYVRDFENWIFMNRVSNKKIRATKKVRSFWRLALNWMIAFVVHCLSTSESVFCGVWGIGFLFEWYFQWFWLSTQFTQYIQMSLKIIQKHRKRNSLIFHIVPRFKQIVFVHLLFTLSFSLHTHLVRVHVKLLYQMYKVLQQPTSKKQVPHRYLCSDQMFTMAFHTQITCLTHIPNVIIVCIIKCTGIHFIFEVANDDMKLSSIQEHSHPSNRTLLLLSANSNGNVWRVCVCTTWSLEHGKWSMCICTANGYIIVP